MAEEDDERGEDARPAVPRIRGSAPRAYVAARALRWRVGRAPQGGVPHDEAMRFLRNLTEQMNDEQGTLVRSMLDEGRILARRLAPVDGVVWRLPGARIFAIQGMAPFLVPDPPAPSDAADVTGADGAADAPESSADG